MAADADVSLNELSLSISRGSPVPLHHQLRNMLQDQIERGTLRPGDSIVAGPFSGKVLPMAPDALAAFSPAVLASRPPRTSHMPRQLTSSSSTCKKVVPRSPVSPRVHDHASCMAQGLKYSLESNNLIF